MIALKPLVRAIKTANLGLFGTIKLILYYIGAYMVLKKFSSIVESEIDDDGIGYLVILAIFADRLADKHNVKIEMVTDRKKISISTEFENIFTFLDPDVRNTLLTFLDAYESLNLTMDAKIALGDVFTAQRVSEMQKLRSLGMRELMDITVHKGGVTGQFHILAFRSRYCDMRAAYIVGAFMQLFDDWIDVRQDRREKVRTLFTEGYMNYGALERIYRWCLDLLDDRYSEMLRWVWSKRFFFKFMKGIIDLF